MMYRIIDIALMLFICMCCSSGEAFITLWHVGWSGICIPDFQHARKMCYHSMSLKQILKPRYA